MLSTQINIVKNRQKFAYGIEYVDNKTYIQNGFTYSIVDEDVVFCPTKQHYPNILRNENEWYVNNTEQTEEYMPTNSEGTFVNLSSINLYFPTYSVDTYEKGVKYWLEICTYINGKKIVLSSLLLDRQEIKAINKGPVKIKGKTYYEYVNIPFIDPWYIIYDDNWAEFRQITCFEPTNINNTGSLISISLFPLDINGEEYRQLDGYVGGVGSIMLSEDDEDMLSVQLSHDCYIRPDYEIRTGEHSCSLSVDLMYNDVYEKTEEDLKLYLLETYGVEDDGMKCDIEVVLKNEDNIYKLLRHSYDHLIINDSFTKEELAVKNWNEYILGLEFLATYTIYNNEEELMVLYSNTIPCTPDVFKYFITTDIDYVKTEEIDMNYFNIDVVNKVQQNIVNVSKPNEYKSNILKPIFIRSYDLDNIIVYPAANDNVAINLDKYKQSVNLFYIKIEGQYFVEIGRTVYGVVFKVDGNVLPNEEKEGIYYILNENKELVATGQYTYKE